MALIAVLRSGDARLAAVTVQGDEIFRPSAGIRTRRRAAAAPARYQQIPLLAKIAKVLIREYASLLEDAKVRVSVCLKTSS